MIFRNTQTLHHNIYHCQHHRHLKHHHHPYLYGCLSAALVVEADKAKAFALVRSSVNKYLIRLNISFK